MSPRGLSRVLIAGGGIAGLEALLALHDLAAGRVRMTLLSCTDEFVYRPTALVEPFGRGRAIRHPLTEIAAHAGAELVRGRLAAVDSSSRTAITTAGDELAYDALLVAVGAHSEPAVPGSLTWTPEGDAELFGGLLRDLEEGYTKRVAFVIPPGVAWTLPAYELALIAAWQAWDMGQDDITATIYTPEDAPLGLFGPRAVEAVQRDLAEAGVRVQTGVCVVEDALVPGRLVVHPGGRHLDTERVVALAQAVGPRLAGLPCDGDSFLSTDRHGRVAGLDGVWAAGDVTAFGVREGGLAAQQGDAAAESIAAAVGVELVPQPFAPTLRGTMLTRRGRQWLHHELADGDHDGTAARPAPWRPPTKIARRYIAPYLAPLDGTITPGCGRPEDDPIDLDLDLDLPSGADTLGQLMPLTSGGARWPTGHS